MLLIFVITNLVFSKTIPKDSQSSDKKIKKIQNCRGIEYLGVGYDAIAPKLIGEDEVNIDLGYRSPILKFKYGKDEGYSTSGCVYPIDTYFRPFISCHKEGTLTKIKSLAEYENAFSIQAKAEAEIKSIDIVANAQFEKSSKNLEENQYREILNVINCYQTEVGIATNLHWDVTDEFIEDVLKLKQAFDHSGGNGVNSQKCSRKGYSASKAECREISRWIRLIKTYGTHYTNKIRIGGKLVQSVKIKESLASKLEEEGFDLEARIQSEMVNISGPIAGKPDGLDDKINKNAIKKVRVIGGVMPRLPINSKTFGVWAKSLDYSPMPIYVETTPLNRLIHQVLYEYSDVLFNVKREYELALNFYAELNGATYRQIKELTGQMPSIVNLTSTLACPDGMHVMVGVYLFFGVSGKIVRISPCKSGSKECGLPELGVEIAFTWGWALCTTDLLPSIEQIMSGDFTEREIECPEGYKTGFGLVFKENLAYFLSGYISAIPKEVEMLAVPAGSAAWMVCFDKSMISDEYNVEIKAANANKEVIAECSGDGVVISARSKECDKFIRGCIADAPGGFVWAICSDN